MPRRHRIGSKFVKAFAPLLFLLLLAAGGGVFWLVSSLVHPPQRPYLITPEKFAGVDPRALKVRPEAWVNLDGTAARGWLVRGDEGAPAVVLLHGYGTDRSSLLNLGLKLNEATNFTVLLPDLRGHGLDPPVASTTFGAREADDVIAAVLFLQTLTTVDKRPLVGARIGFYGVELGAYAALAAVKQQTVKVSGGEQRALLLDSVPAAPDDLLISALRERIGLEGTLLQQAARGGARLYFFGNYRNESACAAAARVNGVRRVLLLSGDDAGDLRTSTDALARCFPPDTSVDVQTKLPLSGLHLSSATGEQGDAYDRRVIEFFDRALR